MTALNGQESAPEDGDGFDVTSDEGIDPEHRDGPRHLDSRIEDVTQWNATEQRIETSVVVVTYKVDRADFEATLDALDEQTADAYEVIVVDNGTDWDVEAELDSRDRCLVYATLADNPGITVARNVGAKLALGDLLVFLDDDGVPEESFVEAHRRVHREYDAVAARGRVLPRTDNVYNRLQKHYDMGAEAKPHFLNIEGNTSFDRETFLEYGGYSEELYGRAGNEGLELTYRMVSEGDVDRDQVLYHPDPVIYHDYAEGLLDFLRKRASQPSMRNELEYEYERLSDFAHTYSETRAELPDLGPLDHARVAVLEVAIRLLRRLPRAR